MTRRTENWFHDELLIEHRKQKKSISAFAQRFKIAASVVREHAQRLGISEAKPERLTYDIEQGRPFKDKPNPINVAMRTLGSRLTERSGGYFLDGQPVSLNQIMRETNRHLKKWGLEQITVNPAWVVE